MTAADAAGAPPSLLRRDRVSILLALAGVTAVAWAYLFVLARDMPAMDMAGMAMPMPWTASTFALTLAMWAVMMVGMMLPSAAPMILMFAAMNRRQRERGSVAVPTSVFVIGYVLVWAAFSLGATVLQWELDRLALLSPMLAATSMRLSGAVFLCAGAYQLTPLKQICLRHCRSPFAFLLNQWRDGWGGALRMGVAHGVYCLGCCWMLMALLFAVGVMNLLWVAALAALVFVEKLLPGGIWVARGGGVLIAAYGVRLLLA
jgi:predicted metal-binding membrane protein